MILINSKIVLLIVAINCCLTLHSATALVRRSRISRVMRLPEQNESEIEATTTTTTEHTTIEARAENVADKGDDAKAVDDDGQNDNSAAKTQLQAGAANTSLSIWSAVRGLLSLLRNGISESFLESTSEVAGRTFAKIRRLQLAIIPLIFKIGLLTAMVSFLVMLGIKTIFLLKLILLMNAVGLLAKFFTLKLKLGHHIAEPSWGHAKWNYEPMSNAGWSADQPIEHQAPSKEIHLHIHGGQLQNAGYSQLDSYGSHGSLTQGWNRRSDPYAAYFANAQTAPNSAIMGNEQMKNSELYPYLPINHKTNQQQAKSTD